MSHSLLAIEYSLTISLRPHFLSVTQEADVISIVISHPSFVLLSTQDRVSLVFNLLNKSNPDIIKTNQIIVQPYSSDEMMDLFEHLGK